MCSTGQRFGARVQGQGQRVGSQNFRPQCNHMFHQFQHQIILLNIYSNFEVRDFDLDPYQCMDSGGFMYHYPLFKITHT